MGERRRDIQIQSLSDDTFLKIFSRLPPSSLARSATVCKSWNNLIKTSSLWQHAYIQFRECILSRHGKNTASICHLYNFDLLEAPISWKPQFVKEKHRALLAIGRPRVHNWKGHNGRVECCRTIAGVVATGCSDGTIHLWRASSRPLETYVAPNKSTVLDFEIDESKVVGIASDKLCIWSREKLQLLRSISAHGQRLYSMCYVDPEVALGCVDGSIRVFDLYSSRCVRIFRCHNGSVTCVKVDTGLSIMATGSTDGTVKLFDFHSGQSVACLLSPSPPIGVHCLHMSAEKNTLIGGTSTGMLYSWDIRTQKQLWSSRISTTSLKSIHAPTFDCDTIAVGGFDGYLNVIDGRTGDILTRLIRSQGFVDPCFVNGNRVDMKQAYAKSTDCKGMKVEGSQASLSNMNRPPILSIRTSMSRILTTHTNGMVSTWDFRI